MNNLFKKFIHFSNTFYSMFDIRSKVKDDRIKFPYIHDIARLLILLSEAGLDIPEYIRESERLTPYAFITRYPSISPPIDKDYYYKFIEIAEKVVHWVDSIISAKQ